MTGNILSKSSKEENNVGRWYEKQANNIHLFFLNFDKPITMVIINERVHGGIESTMQKMWSKLQSEIYGPP
jgi:hypothetical protein